MHSLLSLELHLLHILLQDIFIVTVLFLLSCMCVHNNLFSVLRIASLFLSA